MSWRRQVLVPLLLAAINTPAAAQAPLAYLERGIDSYQGLEYDAAAGWFRRALTPPLVEALSPADQLRGLAYLGATERFRGRADSAAAAFRRMLRLDPRARPDPLVFPPEVTRLFEQVRSSYPIVQLGAAPEATLDRDHRGYRVTLSATTPYHVALTLDSPDGRAVDTLYTGPIDDSLSVTWDGHLSSGAAPASGKYWLTAAAVADSPRSCRVRRPFEITARAADTLPLPAPLDAALLLPERAGTEEGPAAAGKAAFFTALALALPLVAQDAQPGQTRILAGAIGVSGVIALIRYRPGRALPENVAANAAARGAWQHRADRIRRENAERRRGGVMEIRTGDPTILGCEVE